MTPIERIDLYLNNQLPASEVAKLEHDLQQSSELQGLLATVDMTRRMIRTQAIKSEVGRVHQHFVTNDWQPIRSDHDDDEGGRVMPLRGRSAGANRPTGWLARMAAAVALILVSYAGYQFATVDRQAVYESMFVPYQLPTTRDAAAPRSVLDSLYRAGNYAAVVRQQTVTSPQEQPRQRFLTGMAHLQLGQYKAAVAQFQALQMTNGQSDTPYFEQEADYYQALAHLGAGNYELAHARLKRIHDNPRHLFHNNVSTSDLWRINLLTYR